MVEMRQQDKAKFGLPIVFVMIGLLGLLFPLAAFCFSRTYENALAHQTELELRAQAQVIASTYQHMLARTVPDSLRYGKPLPASTTLQQNPDALERGEIDLTHTTVLPPPPAAQPTPAPADPYASVAGNAFNELLLDIQNRTGTVVQLADYQGIVVSGATGIDSSVAHIEEAQAALDGRYAMLLRAPAEAEPLPDFLHWFSKAENLRIHVAYPVMYQHQLWGVILLSKDAHSILPFLHGKQQRIFLTAASVVLLFLLVMGVIAFLVTNPIKRLLRQTQRVVEGDIAHPPQLASPGTKEVETLAVHFAHLTEALQERTAYIRAFATHMSDEFTTPLTGIESAAEMLVEHLDDMEPVQRRRFLNNIIQGSERMKRLVSNMLDLAKADHMTPSGHTCYIMPILKRLQERYAQEKLTITIEGEGHCDATIPTESFETVMKNLLDNARENGAEGVHITLTLSEAEVTIRVADDGQGVAEEDSERVFTPFYTTRSAQGGTGLGLGIARSLIDAHGGSIHNEPAIGGAVFIIILPVIH